MRHRFLCWSMPVLLMVVLILSGCDMASVEDEVEPRVGRGATISTTLQAEKSVAQLNSEFAALGLPLSASFDVAIYTLVYETIDAKGSVTQASGALFIPKNASGRRPVASYQHGTLTARNEAPSAGSFEQVIGLVFAATGYVAALPDLLGLGQSPGMHPYVHASSSASAVIDMLRATQDFAALNGVPLNDQLFLLGYSQGGYTAMAAHREIETNHRDEFQVTASAPMAGPYDLSGVMAETFTNGQPHPSPYYLAYTLFAYNHIYDLFPSPSDFLRAPYDVLLPPLFDGTHTGGEIDAVMPNVPGEIIRPDVFAAFLADPNHPLRVRLRENDVYDWTPQAPMRLYHCAQDEQVPPANSQVALARFHQRGALQVEFIDPLPTGRHGTCVGPSLISAKFWFDTLIEAASAAKMPAAAGL